MPIFYDYLRAPSPRRARILLAEKGIAHDVWIVDLAAGEQLSEAFRALNPACTVPALALEDGAVLTDNAAIAAWARPRIPSRRCLAAPRWRKLQSRVGTPKSKANA